LCAKQSGWHPWTNPRAYSQLCLVGDDVKLRQVALRELQCGLLGALDAQGDPKLSNPRRGLPDFQVLWHGGYFVILIFLGNATNAVFRLTSISSFGFDDWSWLTNRLTENDSTQRKLSFIQRRFLGSNQFRSYSSDKLWRSNSNSYTLYVFMSLGCFLPLCGWGLSGRIVTCVSFNKTSAKRGCLNCFQRHTKRVHFSLILGTPLMNSYGN